MSRIFGSLYHSSTEELMELYDKFQKINSKNEHYVQGESYDQNYAYFIGEVEEELMKIISKRFASERSMSEFWEMHHRLKTKISNVK